MHDFFYRPEKPTLTAKRAFGLFGVGLALYAAILCGLVACVVWTLRALGVIS